VARTQPDVAAAVRQLTANGAEEFVLDLRNNLGGLVEEGVEVARLFLDGKATHPLSYRAVSPVHTMLLTGLFTAVCASRVGIRRLQ